MSGACSSPSTGSWDPVPGAGVQRLVGTPVADPGREDDEGSGPGELVGAAAGDSMTRTR